MHPEALFAGKIEKIKAASTPHPLINPGGHGKMIADTEANFQKRVLQEQNVTNERFRLGRAAGPDPEILKFSWMAHRAV
jgi:hypothetical protein